MVTWQNLAVVAALLFGSIVVVLATAAVLETRALQGQTTHEASEPRT
jgi:hypothetical protein